MAFPGSSFLRHLRARARRSGAAAGIAAWALAAPAPAGNAPPPPSTVEQRELAVAFGHALDALSRSMIEWIGEATGYDVTGLLADPPRLVFAAAGHTIDFGDAVLRLTPSLKGAYVHPAHAVVLALPWQLESTADRSVLLHELVHAAQLRARRWRCTGEMEWQAYRLQRRWLLERGVELQLDWLLVGVLSHCPDDGPDAAAGPGG